MNVSQREKRVKQEPTKEFLTAVRLDDFYDTRTKGFNGGNVVRKNPHVSRLSRNIYLNYILGVEDSLEFDKEFRARQVNSSDLVGKDQREL